MKKFSFFYPLFFSLLIFAHASGQVLPPNQTEQNPCTPLQLCGGGTTTAGSYQGNPSANANYLPGTGCLPGFTDVLFWQVTFSAGGIFVFTLTPTNACDDYDWVVYEINASLPCPGNLTSAVVLRSDANDIYNSPGGLTGLSTTAPIPGLYCQPAGVGPAFLDSLHVVAGETLLVAINNAGPYACPGVVPAPVNISFAGSTAVFLDTLKPLMAYVASSCNLSSQITVHMNKLIQCGSIAQDGSDFTVSGGGIVSAAAGVGCLYGGTTQDINVNFATPLPVGTYTLSIKKGTDGNTLLDVCDTAVAIPDTVNFTVNPFAAIAYKEVIPPSCNEIRIALAARVLCSSIAANGSDFSITGPQGLNSTGLQGTNIAGAYGVGCDTNNLSDTVVILLQQPLQADGTYTVTARNGTDGNTLVDSCGHSQVVGNTITFKINSFDGLLKVFPNDTAMCQGGYIDLRTANTALPPDSVLSCGTPGIQCAGAGSHYPSSGRDSVSDIHSPFYGFGKSRLQFLYTAQELRNTGMEPGTIQSIGWKLSQVNTANVFEDMTIKIGCTNATVIDGDFLSGLQQVYNTAAYFPVQGWNLFTLATPFNWDGVSNLVVEICNNNSSSSYVSNAVDNSVTNFRSVLNYYTYSSSGSGCALTQSGGGTTDVENYYLRPKTRFNMCPAPAGNSSDFAYTWSPSLYLSSITVPDPEAYVLNTTKYTAQIIDRYGCAHRDTAHVNISVRNPSLIPKNDTALCMGHAFVFTAAGGITYQWFATDISSLSCTNCSSPTVTPTVNGMYQVIISDQYNCADTLSDSIMVYPIPNVLASPHDTTVVYGAMIQLLATGASQYMWTPADMLNNSGIPNPIANVIAPEAIEVIGIDSNGCHSMDTVNIHVNYRSPILIPSAFTPNNDGKNDVFKVAGLTNQRIDEFRVFNRWGQEVFTTTSNDGGWDGTKNGIPQDIGVYKYIIRIVYPDGFLETHKGDVTLIR